MRLARTVQIIIAFGLALSVAAPGCSRGDDLAERELELLRRELAVLKAEKRTPEVRVGQVSASAREEASQRVASRPAGPPPMARAPDPTSPPTLPVIKLAPRQDPFAGGKEPTIRIGKGGRVAPPVSTRSSDGPLEYDHIDSYGNLIDKDGRIVYRAGTDSPDIDTNVEEAEEPGFEDPHESPRSRIDRAMQVPRVFDPASKSHRESRPGLEAMDGGGPVGDGTTSRRQLRQFVIGAPELSPDRHRQIMVSDAPPRTFEEEAPIHIEGGTALPPAAAPSYPSLQPEAAPEPVVEPAAAPPVVVHDPEAELPPLPVSKPALAPEPAPVVVAAPAPAASPDIPAPAAEYKAPERAPGPQRVITQKRYRGSREKKAQEAYKLAMIRLNAKEFDEAERDFKTMLTKYSDHDLADNALYWLAETAYTRGRWSQALAWFQDVILRYPEGNKLADAMLKSALCYARLGDTSYAVQMLTEVEALFASAPVAEVARKRRLTLAQGDDG